MELLFNIKILAEAKSEEFLPLQCKYCKKVFERQVKYIRNSLKQHNGKRYQFCSVECMSKSYITALETKCSQCQKNIKKQQSEVRKNKSGRFFCSSSCAATYNNQHKSHGTRRSKLEIWLEQELRTSYPKLDIKFNDKDAINSELDIYFPTLSLAVELNGIFHYEPIYGSTKLTQIQNNDNRKFQACLEHGIELLIIDVSKLEYFKPKKSQRYFEIIKIIVDQKLVA
ncbi:MAG: hypothetical protein AAB649_01695 [Patescibacteria group bacterium]